MDRRTLTRVQSISSQLSDLLLTDNCYGWSWSGFGQANCKRSSFFYKGPIHNISHTSWSLTFRQHQVILISTLWWLFFCEQAVGDSVFVNLRQKPLVLCPGSWMTQGREKWGWWFVLFALYTPRTIQFLRTHTLLILLTNTPHPCRKGGVALRILSECTQWNRMGTAWNHKRALTPVFFQ